MGPFHIMNTHLGWPSTRLVPVVTVYPERGCSGCVCYMVSSGGAGPKRWENNDDLYTGEEERYQLTTNESPLAKPRCSGSTPQLKSHRRHRHAHGTCS